MKKINNVEMYCNTSLWKIKPAFTLIEVIVSITILAIVLISVFAVFFLASDLSNKADVNRLMQENIKNIVETISEDVRKNWIKICDTWTDCHNFPSDALYISWNDLYVWENHYYLAKKDIISDSYTRVFDSNSCASIKDNCSMIRESSSWQDLISNSWVQFSDLKFYISRDFEPKVTINFTILPATWKWIKSNLIESNRILFETTVSERLYDK